MIRLLLSNLAGSRPGLFARGQTSVSSVTSPPLNKLLSAARIQIPGCRGLYFVKITISQVPHKTSPLSSQWILSIQFVIQSECERFYPRNAWPDDHNLHKLDLPFHSFPRGPGHSEQCSWPTFRRRNKGGKVIMLHCPYRHRVGSNLGSYSCPVTFASCFSPASF